MGRKRGRTMRDATKRHVWRVVAWVWFQALVLYPLGVLALVEALAAWNAAEREWWAWCCGGGR